MCCALVIAARVPAVDRDVFEAYARTLLVVVVLVVIVIVIFLSIRGSFRIVWYRGV